MKQNYVALKWLLAFLVLFSCVCFGYAQNRTISGKVTAVDDDSAIPGVNIVVKNTTLGTVTDADGRYQIVVSDAAILVFSSIGYAAQEIPVSGRTIIDLALESDVRSLEEVVVVGYGSQLKKEIT